MPYWHRYLLPSLGIFMGIRIIVQPSNVEWCSFLCFESYWIDSILPVWSTCKNFRKAPFKRLTDKTDVFFPAKSAWKSWQDQSTNDSLKTSALLPPTEMYYLHYILVPVCSPCSLRFLECPICIWIQHSLLPKCLKVHFSCDSGKWTGLLTSLPWGLQI